MTATDDRLADAYAERRKGDRGGRSAATTSTGSAACAASRRSVCDGLASRNGHGFAATLSYGCSSVRFISASLVVALGSQVVVWHIGQGGSAPLMQMP